MATASDECPACGTLGVHATDCPMGPVFSQRKSMSFDSNEDFWAREAYARGRDDERVRIVAWLRRRAEAAWVGRDKLTEAATLIEAGKAPEDVVA